MLRIPLALACAFVALLALPAGASATVQLPVPNLNSDVVVNTGDDSQNRIDASSYAFATQAKLVEVACPTPRGLPDDGVVPATASSPRAVLAFGEGRSGGNAWVTEANEEGFRELDVPDRRYGAVHLFATSTEGTSDLAVELTYATGPSETVDVAVTDWFFEPPPQVSAPLGGLDRIGIATLDRCDSADDSSANDRLQLFSIGVPADEGRTLTTVRLTRVAGEAFLAVFGAVGDAPQLTATASGSGTGTVTSDDGNIACGSDCAEIYDFGATGDVVLTATPAPGQLFTGWSGACTGTGTCVVPRGQDNAVDARFEVARELTVTRAGDGTGAVTSSPGGIACGDDCSEAYPQGTTVTLTPSSAPGTQFAGWSGACTGMTFECVVTMDDAKTVTARFGRVIADDFTRVPGPSLTPDVTAPTVTTKLARRVRRRALRRGLPVRITCSERCTLVVEVRKGAKRIGRVTGTANAKVAKTLRVRLSAKTRRALRRTKRLRIRIVATDVIGNATRPLSRTVRLRG